MSTKQLIDYAKFEKKGGTKKIKDYDKKNFICADPEHNPPTHQHFTPGLYEHECPSCGKKQVFEVPLVTMDTYLGNRYDDESPDYIKSSIEE